MLVQKFVFELALANKDANSFHICHTVYGLHTGNIITCVKSRWCRVCLDLATARNGRQMAQRNTQSSAAASAWYVEKCAVTQCGRGVVLETAQFSARQVYLAQGYYKH